MDKSLQRCRAIIMAGGRSERMRADGGCHKALSPVGGRPLLEWNLSTLLREGFSEITIAIGAHSAEVEQYAAALARQSNASIHILRETTPLGTIGAARIACDGADAVLVVNVDNLTTLPLRRFVAHHFENNAALTIASHTEPFQIPFGQLIVGGGGIIEEYRENPIFPVRVSSGVYVVGSAAAELIEENRRFDITHLFAAAQARGLRICAFEHQCDWIDINDAKSLERAQQLFTQRAEALP